MHKFPTLDIIACSKEILFNKIRACLLESHQIHRVRRTLDLAPFRRRPHLLRPFRHRHRRKSCHLAPKCL